MNGDLLTVGAGSAEIPLSVPVELAGYARRDGPARTVHDPLRVRTTLLRTPDSAVAIVVVDLLYVPTVVAELLRGVTAEVLEVDPASILVAATHTHCAPAGLATSVALHPGLRAAAREAALRATASAEPARLAFATVPLAGISANRRHRDGTTDRLARILIAKPVADPARTLATMVNLPCHATVLDHQWNAVSADFPGVACAEIERAVGGTATYLQGFAGDINPATAGTGWSECTRIGRIVASTVSAAVLRAQGLLAGLRVESPTHQTLFDVTTTSGCRELTPRLSAAWTDVAVTPTPQRSSSRPEGSSAAARESEDWIAELLAREPNLFGTFESGLPDELRIQVLTLAEDVRIVALPGEPFGATAEALRAAVPGELVTAGYANQSIGYLPPAAEWITGGYEIGCCGYAIGTEAAICAAAVGLLRRSPG